MTREILKEKIERILYECDKHVLRISQAVEDLKSIMPLNKQSYVDLDKDAIQALDQFLFRFAKLQDAIGRKLFKQILILKEDDALLINNMTFIDILNSLEKLDIVKTKVWQRLRDIRNELAYNYDDEPQEMAEVINKIYEEKETLIDIYAHAKAYYEKIK